MELCLLRLKMIESFWQNLPGAKAGRCGSNAWALQKKVDMI